MLTYHAACFNNLSVSLWETTAKNLQTNQTRACFRKWVHDQRPYVEIDKERCLILRLLVGLIRILSFTNVVSETKEQPE